MSDYKDICQPDRQLPIQQLNKLNDKGTKRDNFFPLSVVQAIFDKTGIRLDTIISSFNYIFLPWQGSKEDTRLQVVGLMRRKSLVICYRDLDDNVIIEMYVGTDRNDDAWKDDANWIDFSDWIVEVIENIMGNLDNYPDIYEIIKNIIQEGMSNLVTNWLIENAEGIINNYLDKADIDSKVEQLFNNYVNDDDFINKVISEVNKLFNSINFDEKINTWLINNATQIIQDYIDSLNINEQIKQLFNEYIATEEFNNKIIQEVDNKFNQIDFTTKINTWLGDNAQSIIEEYLTNLNINQQIQDLFNTYVNGDEFNDKIINEVDIKFGEIDFDSKINECLTNYFNEHPITDFIKEVIENYLHSDEFVGYFETYIDNSVNNWMEDNLQPPTKQFMIKGVLTGNDNLNGYFVGGIFNSSYFNIYIDDIEYSFNVASIVNNNTNETYFNSDYYLVGDINLWGTTYYEYYPLLSCVSYKLGKQIDFSMNITDEKYISGYISRTKITKTFNIYNKNTSKLEVKKVNVVYDGGYFIITEGDASNLSRCEVYVLNPKFTNNIPTGE